jgi:hypothetical protein
MQEKQIFNQFNARKSEIQSTEVNKRKTSIQAT